MVNPALEGFLGRGAADLRRSSGAALTHPHDRETEQQLLAELIAGHIPCYRLRKRFLRPDGSVVWGDLSVAGLRNDDGSLRCYVSQIVDVSDLIQSQEQESVRVVERNRILDNIPVAIVCATPDAAPTARALYTNRSFEQTFGYGVEDAPTLQDWLQRAFASIAPSSGGSRRNAKPGAGSRTPWPSRSPTTCRRAASCCTDRAMAGPSSTSSAAACWRCSTWSAPPWRPIRFCSAAACTPRISPPSRR
ncbi:MAG: PAS domain S-box protein [Cyanobacteriota bacterium]